MDDGQPSEADFKTFTDQTASYYCGVLEVGNIAMIVPGFPRNGLNPLKNAPPEVCYRWHSVVRSYWDHGNHLDIVFSIMLLQVFLVFFLSRAIYWLLRPFKQPTFVCNVLAGIILGPSVLGSNKKFKEHVFGPEGVFLMSIISLFGLIYFVFLVTVKLDVPLILRTAKTTWRIAVAGYVLPFITTFALCNSLKLKFNGHEGGRPSFLTASVLSFTCFTVIAHALNELNLLTSELGQLALSLSIIFDASHMVLSVVFSTLQQRTVIQTFSMGVSLLAFVGIAVYAIRPAILTMIKSTPKGKPVREIYIVATFVVVAVMAIFSNLMGLTVIHGAILLGLVIPNGPPFGTALAEKSELLVTQVFLPFVYVHVGYETNIHAIKNWKTFFDFQIVIAASYGAMVTGVFLAALYSKIKLKNAILLSLIMNFRGVIELFVFRKMLQVHFLDTQSFTQLVLSTMCLSMIITPVVEIYYKPQMRLARNQSISQKGIRSIQELWNESEFRIISCVHSQYNVRSIIALLESSNSAEASPLFVYVIHLVELIGRAFPLLVEMEKLEKSSGSMNSANSEHIMRAFQNFSTHSRGQIAITPFVLIAPYKSMHECIFRFAQDKMIHFIIVPFHENHRLVTENHAISSIRHFNTSLQASAPCTVGILVDKCFRCHLGSKNFSCRVAVIFLGGNDDREALALAARMSSHSAVSVTVLHFIIDGDEKRHFDQERILDEFLIDEFKLKNRRNPRVAVREIVVDDRVKVIDSMRSIENNYDLMMVGRRQGNATTIDEEMSGFVENEELGVMGDMLASSDVCGGEASVLVMHHSSHRVTYTVDSQSSRLAPDLQRSNGG